MPPATDAAPAPTTTDVSQGAPSTGAVPSSFRPPNPAFDAVAKRMTARLTKTAAPPETPPKPEPPPEPITEPETPPPAPEPEETETETPGAPDKTEEAPAEAPPKKEKKLSPWRVIDDYKKTTAELKAKVDTYEKELATLRNGKPQEIPVEWQERLQKAEARVKEYEDDLRFTNYQKHPEYIEKYEKPYKEEYSRTMHKLQGVPVQLPDGTTRPIEVNDIFKLLILPAAEAEVRAKDLFGEFSGTVIRRVEKLQDLFDAQQNALKDARENGAVREKQMREQHEAQTAEATKAINGTWETANRETVTDPKYGKLFTPVEGDQKGNAVLAKGFELVDKAFKLSPTEPGITAEERTERVRRHAAMRHRAAAFGRMRQWIEERDARIADLEKQLDEYSTSEPGQGGGKTKPSAAPSVPADPFARFKANLQKRAR